jgi:hypothetical protein
MALSVSLSVGSKTPSHSIEWQVGEVDSLAPFQGANAIPCPLGMDIELTITLVCCGNEKMLG